MKRGLSCGVGKVICAKCGGSGSTADGRNDCPVCRGTGCVKKELH